MDAMVVSALLILTLISPTLTHEIDSGLSCVTRESPLSGSRDDDLTKVTCQGIEKMTGCSSYLPGPGGHGNRDGEFIEVSSDGEATCFAQNGGYGTGVIAYARCCISEGMQCGYAEAAISGVRDNDNSTVSLLVPGRTVQPTGCSATTRWRHIDGAMPNSVVSQTLTEIRNAECIAQNGAGGSGIEAHGVYCSAPNLQCQAKWSVKGDGDLSSVATVSCDNGWTMTGCSSYTTHRMNDGAYIAHDVCFAVNGGNNQYIYAIAICCRKA